MGNKKSNMFIIPAPLRGGLGRGELNQDSLTPPPCLPHQGGGIFAIFRLNIICFKVFLISIFLLPSKVFASVASEVNKANGLYKQGKYDDSIERYQRVLNQDEDFPVVNFNLGTALYKKGEYAQAQGFLEKVSKDKNAKLKSKAEYNLGNVLYRSGLKKVNEDIDESIKSLQKAIEYYKQSAVDDPSNQDALANSDFVTKQKEKLKELKKLQQKRQGSGNGKSKKDNAQDQNKQGKDQQQQSQQQGKEQKSAQQEDQGKQQDQGKKRDQLSKQKADKKSLSQDKAGEKGKKDKKEKNARAMAEDNQKELDRKQAEDILEDYQETEEPKKLLNYMPRKINDRPVLKDW